MKTRLALLAAFCGLLTLTATAATPNDGSVLPFPPTPSASKAGPTLQESVHQRRVEPDRLPKGAPNVLIKEATLSRLHGAGTGGRVAPSPILSF